MLKQFSFILPILGTNNALNVQMNNNTRKYYKSLSYGKLRHSTERSYLKIIFKFIAEIFINALIVIPLSVFVVLMLPLKLFKMLIFQLYKIICDKNAELLTPMELLWLHDSKFNRSISSALLIIDGNISKNMLKDMITNRIINAHTRLNKKQFPRFTQRIAKLWSIFGDFWTDCDTFSLDEHLIELSNDINNELDLKQKLSFIHSTSLNLTKPLWNIYFKNNFGTQRETIILFVYHLSFIDGISSVRLFFKTLIDNRLIYDIKPRFGHKNLKLKLFKNVLFGWHRIFYNLFFKKRDINLFKFPKYLSGQKIVTWSEAFSMVDVNRLKLVTRTTINDIVLSIVSGIVRSYFKKSGIKNPGDVNCVQSIDLTTNSFPFKIANHSTLGVIRLTSNSEATVPRLWDIKENSINLKSHGSYLSYYMLINFAYSILPHFLAKYLLRSLLDMNTLMVSTLAAGTNNYSTVSISNKSVKNILYFYPCVSNIALSLSIVSYGDEIRLCLVADSSVITHPEFICNEFIQQFELLKELIGHRRIPGEIKKPIRDLPSLNTTQVHKFDDDMTIEDAQSKMSTIQSELFKLTKDYSMLKVHSNDFFHEKSQISTRLESLRKDFRNILVRIKDDKNKSLPSDEEDELEPTLRAKLRSASRTSLSSHGKHKESSHEVKRKTPSLSKSHSRHSSLSFAAVSTHERTQHQQVNRSHSTAIADKFKSDSTSEI